MLVLNSPQHRGLPMPSERGQRNIERLLDEADEAISRSDGYWLETALRTPLRTQPSNSLAVDSYTARPGCRVESGPVSSRLTALYGLLRRSASASSGEIMSNSGHTKSDELPTTDELYRIPLKGRITAKELVDRPANRLVGRKDRRARSDWRLTR